MKARKKEKALNASPVDRTTSRRTLRKRLHRMNEVIPSNDNHPGFLREVMRNQKAIMKFLLTHIKGENQ